MNRHGRSRKRSPLTMAALFAAVMGLALSLALPALAFDYAKWIGKEGMADTFDALLAQYDSSACEKCHADIYKEWKESFHAVSIVSSLKSITGFYTKGIQSEWDREFSLAESVKCLDCHIPQVNTATEKLARKVADMVILSGTQPDSAEGKAAKEKLEKLSINCVVCHNMKANMAAIGYLKQPIKEPSDADKALGITARVYIGRSRGNAPHSVTETNGMTNSVFCEQCHGIWVSPDGEKIQCNSLSGSYEDSYRARGGYKQCQDCHMREKNRGHRFPGGHDFDGIVKESMVLDVDALAIQRFPDNSPASGKWLPSVVASVRITSRAGHRIPDG